MYCVQRAPCCVGVECMALSSVIVNRQFVYCTDDFADYLQHTVFTNAKTYVERTELVRVLGLCCDKLSFRPDGCIAKNGCQNNDDENIVTELCNFVWPLFSFTLFTGPIYTKVRLKSPKSQKVLPHTLINFSAARNFEETISDDMSSHVNMRIRHTTLNAILHYGQNWRRYFSLTGCNQVTKYNSKNDLS